MKHQTAVRHPISTRSKLLSWIALCISPVLAPTAASAQEAASTMTEQPNVERRRLSPQQVRAVAPALEQFTQARLYGEVWKRPGLSPRDRSLATVAALIARGEAPALGYYANQALENGLTPVELSETVTHLAFYAGWGRAMAAVGPIGEVFAARSVPAKDLPPAFGPLQPLDEAKDEARAQGVAGQFGAVSAGTVEYTNGLLFRELWQRPYLSQRDRSFVTVAALIASNQPEQVRYHLGRAMDAGVTKTEAGEMLTQLAFYVGWPAVFSAMPVVKSVFEARAVKAGAAK